MQKTGWDTEGAKTQGLWQRGLLMTDMSRGTGNKRLLRNPGRVVHTYNLKEWQEGQFTASLGYMKPCLKNKTKHTKEHSSRANENEPKGQNRKKVSYEWK